MDAESFFSVVSPNATASHFFSNPFVRRLNIIIYKIVERSFVGLSDEMKVVWWLSQWRNRNQMAISWPVSLCRLRYRIQRIEQADLSGCFLCRTSISGDFVVSRPLPSAISGRAFCNCVSIRSTSKRLEAARCEVINLIYACEEHVLGTRHCLFTISSCILMPCYAA